MTSKSKRYSIVVYLAEGTILSISTPKGTPILGGAVGWDWESNSLTLGPNQVEKIKVVVEGSDDEQS